jgi:hypothetical protein
MNQARNPRQKGIDPTLTRKRGFFRHPGSILLALLAIAFAAYVSGHLPQADTAYQSLLDLLNGQRAHALIVWQYAPIVGLGIALLLIVSYIWKRINQAHKNFSIRRLVAGRNKISESQFSEMAARHAVSAKVAHHVYKRLQRDYGHDMRVALTDDLRDNLHWKDVRVLNVMMNLTMHCNRRKQINADEHKIRTVLDLLSYIENCPPQSLTASGAHRRAMEQQQNQHQ